MAALAFRYVCGLRRQWRSWVLLSIVCGLAAALPIAVAANTRRTESALPRLLHQHHAPVAMVSADASQVGQAAAVQFLAEVGALPDVASRSRYAAVFLSLMTDDGSIDQRLQIGDAAGKVLDQAAMDDDGAFRLLHGRLPDPERADEVVANPEFLALTGWKVDDTVSSLRLYRFTDMDDGEPIPTKGTQLHLTIVGEVRRPEGTPTPPTTSTTTTA